MDMDSMFRGCSFLEGFTFGNKFDPRSGTSMKNMFENCYYGNKEMNL